MICLTALRKVRNNIKSAQALDEPFARKKKILYIRSITQNEDFGKYKKYAARGMARVA